ncbi:MAG: ABC transporter permease [Bacteroidetes bacterium]|nr:MAG: ABC transporter permease [Bacteroidota bacterium]
MLFKEIRYLLYKELVLEWRERYALNGILLYVVSTVMVCYLSFSVKQSALNPPTWNALFWIIMLFSATNAVAKSFQQERRGRLLYYYTLASPEAIILSKIIYNTLLLSLLSGITLVVYSVLLDNPVQDLRLFSVGLLLGSAGLAGTLTLVAGIASKVENNATLMAVLSFPIVLPLLLMLIKLSRNALDGLDNTISYDEIGVLFSLNVMVITLSYLLFPYLWRS